MAQKIVITGGMGFLGQNLCRALLQRSGTTPIQITLVDTISTTSSSSKADDSFPWSTLNPKATVEVVVGDIGDASFCETVIDQDTSSIFHLAAAMSGECETNPDLGA